MIIQNRSLIFDGNNDDSIQSDETDTNLPQRGLDQVFAIKGSDSQVHYKGMPGQEMMWLMYVLSHREQCALLSLMQLEQLANLKQSQTYTMMCAVGNNWVIIDNHSSTVSVYIMTLQIGIRGLGQLMLKWVKTTPLEVRSTF